MRYYEEVKSAGDDAYRIEDRLDDALASIRRAVEDAAECGCEDIASDLGLLEESLVEIMDDIETAAEAVSDEE